MGKKVACSGCREQGRDRSGNNLNLFEDDPSRGWCHVCQKAYSVDGSTTLREVAKTKDDSLEMAAIATFPFRALEDRGISVETCKRFGVRVALDEQTASEITSHYYP